MEFVLGVVAAADGEAGAEVGEPPFGTAAMVPLTACRLNSLATSAKGSRYRRNKAKKRICKLISSPFKIPAYAWKIFHLKKKVRRFKQRYYLSVIKDNMSKSKQDRVSLFN